MLKTKMSLLISGHRRHSTSRHSRSVRILLPCFLCQLVYSQTVIQSRTLFCNCITTACCTGEYSAQYVLAFYPIAFSNPNHVPVSLCFILSRSISRDPCYLSGRENSFCGTVSYEPGSLHWSANLHPSVKSYHL